MRSSITLGIAALAASVSAIDTISVKGAKFFTSSGSQFFVKGVAYQLTENDPLIDGNQCTLDAALMKTLGANSIRVYHVDPTADHKSCMTTFANAGIYLWVDMDTVGTYIDPKNPDWTQAQYSAFSKVMDEFQQFDNTAGFFVGNEVLTSTGDSSAAPYVKAAARDMKAYRNSKGYRNIPVGYSAADISTLRPNLQNYLACGGNSSETLDFFSLNAYEWCGVNTFETSGYSALNAQVANYNIPIFFSETGCNTPEPRLFADQAAILGPDMNSIWSGAIIYEWIQETNNYGLISYGPAVATGADTSYVRTGTPTPVTPDFSNLSTQWATLSPTGVSSAAYSPSNSAPACPAYTSGVWMVSGNAALPTRNNAASGVIGSSGAAATSSTSRATSSATSSASSGSTSGSSTATASSSHSGSTTTSATGSAASASHTGMASPGKEITGMSAGLVAVMLGFVWWL